MAYDVPLKLSATTRTLKTAAAIAIDDRAANDTSGGATDRRIDGRKQNRDIKGKSGSSWLTKAVKKGVDGTTKVTKTVVKGTATTVKGTVKGTAGVVKTSSKIISDEWNDDSRGGVRAKARAGVADGRGKVRRRG